MDYTPILLALSLHLQPVFDKRQILGSYNKPLKFQLGEHTEKIFNELRPKHKIKRYADKIQYNSRMKKVFNEKYLTNDEKKAIREWTKDSTNIKLYMWGLLNDKTAKKHADNLFGLFDKYESNIKKETKLYRGMSFTEDDFRYYQYDKVKKDELHIPDVKAIVSFSTNKRKAFEYATMTDKKYKVVYILENEAKAFDISKISVKPEDKESIITKGREYLVTHTKIFKRGDEIWKVIKLKKM